MMEDNARKIYLEERSDLGQPFAASTFRLHWEFWLQMQMLSDAEWLNSISHIVTAVEALNLATVIERKADDDEWLILLYMWGDSDGEAMASLCRFLKGGGFEVIDLSK